MNVRKIIFALAAIAIGSLAYAESGDIADQVATPENLAITHIDDVGSAAVAMRVTMLPIDIDVVAGQGEVLYKHWYDAEGVPRESYQGTVRVKVPNKVPGFETLKDAMNADVRITLSANGVPYAECMLAVQPVTSRTFVEYALDIRGMYMEIRPHQGVCDVDLFQEGIQVDIPLMHHKDRLTTFVKETPNKYDFLEGYCY